MEDLHISGSATHLQKEPQDLPEMSRYKYWTKRWKVSTFAMEVKRSFCEMKMEHTEHSHSSRAFEKP